LKSSGINYSKDILVLSAGPFLFRDRVDYTISTDGRLGLYNKSKDQLVDLPSCPLLTPHLQSLIAEFRKYKWSFQHKGSVRFRSYKQTWGIWFDLANLDIKDLLQNHTEALQQLSSVAVLEAGQRFKQITYKDSFKLTDPALNPWFSTFWGQQEVPLYCSVGHFTQTGVLNNRLIVQSLQEWGFALQGHGMEFGSGLGNLTIPALQFADSIWACEVSEPATLALKKTWQQMQKQPNVYKNCTNKQIQFLVGDFHFKSTVEKMVLKIQDQPLQWILANPARSGLQKFLDPFENEGDDLRPEYFVLISCYLDSFITDLHRLHKMGYHLQDLKIVDQFPHTSHFETLALLKR
jgi:23S rRNA (uracil1939-C5)-methyltransferase